MSRGGKRPGAGRKKGLPNKVTSVAREVFLATFHRLAPDLEGWIKQTAEGVEETEVDDEGKTVTVRRGANPAKAAELLVRMAEYHYPKRAAVALTGEDGGPIKVTRIERVIIDPAKP